MNAQERGFPPKVEEMHAQKWQFMVDKAKLSPKEIEAVQPVFMEYEKAVWSQHEKNRDFFRSVKKMEGNTKPPYEEMNNRYAEADLIQGQLFKSYHLKLRKILQPEVLFRYYRAEREFKRKLLKDMQEHQRRDK
jgi:hypothetical protein